MKLLGVDYGLNKVGLAISEADLVTPLEVIKTKDAFQRIVLVCHEQEIKTVVIGLPGGPVAPKVRAFGEKLTTLIKAKVVYQDETLTSQDATAKMIEAGKGQKARQARQDAVAAALILQSYLESQNV